MNMDLETIGEIIGRLRQDSARYFPGRSVDEVELEEAIPRPYSQLARLRIVSQEGVERAYLKLYRHPRLPAAHNQSSAEREHGAHATLFEVFQGVDGCGVVRPIAVFPELGGWVMDEVEGPTLGEELYRKGHRWATPTARRDLLRSVTRAGGWLQHLHRQVRRDETVSLDDSGVLEVIADLLEKSTALSDSERQLVTTYSQDLARRLEGARFDVVGQHGECYAPHHIFVTDGRLLVFDITGIKYGPLYEDLSNLWVGLVAMQKYPLFAKRTVQSLQTAFLEGYGSEVGADDPALALYELKNMLKLSDSWGRGASTDWRGWARRGTGRRFLRRWLADRTKGLG